MGNIKVFNGELMVLHMLRSRQCSVCTPSPVHLQQAQSTSQKHQSIAGWMGRQKQQQAAEWEEEFQKWIEENGWVEWRRMCRFVTCVTLRNEHTYTRTHADMLMPINIRWAMLNGMYYIGIYTSIVKVTEYSSWSPSLFSHPRYFIHTTVSC